MSAARWRTLLVVLAGCGGSGGADDVDDPVVPTDSVVETDPPVDTATPPIEPPDLSAWVEEVGVSLWDGPGRLVHDGLALVPWVSPFGGASSLAANTVVFCELQGRPHVVLPSLGDDPTAPTRFGPILELTDDGELLWAGLLSDRGPIPHPSTSGQVFTCADLDRDGHTDLLFPGGDRMILWGAEDGTFTPADRYPLDATGVPEEARLPLDFPRHLSVVHLGGEALPTLLVAAQQVSSERGFVVPALQVEPRVFVAAPELVDTSWDVKPYFLHRARLPGPGGGDHRVLAVGDTAETRPGLQTGQYHRVPAAPGEPAWGLSPWRWAREDQTPPDASWRVQPGIPQTVGILSGVSPMGRALLWRAGGDRPISVVTSTQEPSPVFSHGPWGAPLDVWRELSRPGAEAYHLPLRYYRPSDDESLLRWWGVAGDARLMLVAGGHDAASGRARAFPHNEWAAVRVFFDQGGGRWRDVTRGTPFADAHGSWFSISTWIRGDGLRAWAAGTAHFPPDDPSRPRVWLERPLSGEHALGVVLRGHASLPRGEGSWVSLVDREGRPIDRAAVGGLAQPGIESTHGVHLRVPAERAGDVDHLEVWWESTDLVQRVPVEGLDRRIEVEEPVRVRAAGLVRRDDAAGATWSVDVELAAEAGIDRIAARASALPGAGAAVVTAVDGGWRVEVALPTASSLVGAAPVVPSWPASRLGALLGRVELEVDLLDGDTVRGRVSRRALVVDAR